MLVEIPVVLLVVAEIVVLFAGVGIAYGFHRPVVWSDELASILFLWLAMLGAVAAFRRGEHMRMTAVVNMTSPHRQVVFEVLAVAALVGLPSARYSSSVRIRSRRGIHYHAGA
jgi:TRAP-type C4-dicarboxylate transport system permease small subunit